MGAEIWLYGSVARNTHSHLSDLDVLVVSDIESPSAELSTVVSGLPQANHLSVRRYSWREVSKMYDYGSLFLLHLKLEGRLLQASSSQSVLTEMLANLPDYRNSTRDIRGFLQALQDVRRELDDTLGKDDLLFELGVIATIIRHCSILACYRLGAPCFQTSESIRASFAAVKMASIAEAAIDLYHFRLATARRIPSPVEPSLTAAELWLRRARVFVERVGDL